VSSDAYDNPKRKRISTTSIFQDSFLLPAPSRLYQNYFTIGELDEFLPIIIKHISNQPITYIVTPLRDCGIPPMSVRIAQRGSSMYSSRHVERFHWSCKARIKMAFGKKAIEGISLFTSVIHL
jgi:hypothetical protein